MNKIIFKGDCNYIDIHHNKAVNLDINGTAVNAEIDSPDCSAELMDNISFIHNHVNEEELAKNAKDILVKECNLTEKQADAMVNVSIILEKNKYGNKD